MQQTSTTIDFQLSSDLDVDSSFNQSHSSSSSPFQSETDIQMKDKTRPIMFEIDDGCNNSVNDHVQRSWRWGELPSPIILTPESQNLSKSNDLPTHQGFEMEDQPKKAAVTLGWLLAAVCCCLVEATASSGRSVGHTSLLQATAANVCLASLVLYFAEKILSVGPWREYLRRFLRIGVREPCMQMLQHKERHWWARLLIGRREHLGAGVYTADDGEIDVHMYWGCIFQNSILLSLHANAGPNTIAGLHENADAFKQESKLVNWGESKESEKDMSLLQSPFIGDKESSHCYMQELLKIRICQCRTTLKYLESLRQMQMLMSEEASNAARDYTRSWAIANMPLSTWDVDMRDTSSDITTYPRLNGYIKVDSGKGVVLQCVCQGTEMFYLGMIEGVTNGCMGDVTMSLCGGLNQYSVPSEKSFCQHQNTIDLLTAAHTPLALPASKEIEPVSESGRSYSSWFSWRRKLDYNTMQERESCNTLHERGKEGYSASDSSLDSNMGFVQGINVPIGLNNHHFISKQYRKTLRLSSEQIASLNLQDGPNDVTFSVTTAYQGTTRCQCHIYKWHFADKIVISDIDGTITKSDVLGHLFAIVGKDWAQIGVAQLFTKIKNNGYKLLYLSARAIGQAHLTREYLRSIRQNDLTLPDGPLLLSPTSLINAIHRTMNIEEEEKDLWMSYFEMMFILEEERDVREIEGHDELTEYEEMYVSHKERGGGCIKEDETSKNTR
uniref:(California timema) hypothetical protein n=1 Tax=Timema californicum TaxID=61474 RepID=A0A7R9J9Y5_TIMCA|nr:unnamed protein product [Timema californicum]